MPSPNGHQMPGALNLSQTTPNRHALRSAGGATALTPLATYYVPSAAQDTNPLVSPTFTPATGELIVVKAGTWSSTDQYASVTGGGFTYTLQTQSALSGFLPYSSLYTTVVTASPGPMAVTATPNSSSRHWMVVERWAGQIGAVTSPVNGTDLPQAAVTIPVDGAAITWTSGDVASIDPSTRAYLLGATEDGFFDGHIGANGVAYFAWASVATAGTYVAGMSAPGGQKWSMAGIAILPH